MPSIPTPWPLIWRVVTNRNIREVLCGPLDIPGTVPEAKVHVNMSRALHLLSLQGRPLVACSLLVECGENVWRLQRSMESLSQEGQWSISHSISSITTHNIGPTLRSLTLRGEVDHCMVLSLWSLCSPLLLVWYVYYSISTAVHN